MSVRHRVLIGINANIIGGVTYARSRQSRDDDAAKISSTALSFTNKLDGLTKANGYHRPRASPTGGFQVQPALICLRSGKEVK